MASAGDAAPSPLLPEKAHFKLCTIQMWIRSSLQMRKFNWGSRFVAC